MNAPILVTGGAGTIGVRAVPLLRAAGANVRILSRHPRGDGPGIRHLTGNMVTGQGLDAALEGIGTVLRLAGGAKGGDVAARFVELTLGEPGGLVADVVGPEVIDIPHLVTTYAKFHGRRHPAMPVRLPGAVGRAYRVGANLAGTEAVRTRRGWAQFLAERAATTDSDARAAADHRR